MGGGVWEDGGGCEEEGMEEERGGSLYFAG